jgi:hypothetical protein
LSPVTHVCSRRLPIHDRRAGREVRSPNPCSASAHYRGRARFPLRPPTLRQCQEQKSRGDRRNPGPRNRKVDPPARPCRPRSRLSGYLPSVPAADRKPWARSCVAWQTAFGRSRALQKRCWTVSAERMMIRRYRSAWLGVRGSAGFWPHARQRLDLVEELVLC